MVGVVVGHSGSLYCVPLTRIVWIRHREERSVQWNRWKMCAYFIPQNGVLYAFLHYRSLLHLILYKFHHKYYEMKDVHKY